MSFYKKVFENVLNEAEGDLPPVDAQSDAAEFEKGFEKPEDFAQVDAETQGAIAPVEDMTATIEAADRYSEIISSKIVPFLNKLQNEFLEGGIFMASGMSPPNFSSLTTNLAKLATELPSKLKDVAAKKANEKQQKA